MVTDSDAVLRLKQQIIMAITEDPDAVPDLLIDLGLIDPASAAEVMGALKMAEYVADREEVDRG